jgi:hypothetical protein
MVRALPIGLDSSIIQDGNYADFKVGQVRAFALEFCALEPLMIVSDERAVVPSYINETGAHFSIVGKSTYTAVDWWVVDFGMLAYTPYPSTTPHKTGALFEGGVYLGIDHFDYFERLSKSENAPALIFDWKVERIQMQTAPFIERGDRMRIRDPEKIGWCDVSQTNAWEDDKESAEYILHCTRLTDVPRHALDR